VEENLSIFGFCLCCFVIYTDILIIWRFSIKRYAILHSPLLSPFSLQSYTSCLRVGLEKMRVLKYPGQRIVIFSVSPNFLSVISLGPCFFFWCAFLRRVYFCSSLRLFRFFGFGASFLQLYEEIYWVCLCSSVVLVRVSPDLCPTRGENTCVGRTVPTTWDDPNHSPSLTLSLWILVTFPSSLPNKRPFL